MKDPPSLVDLLQTTANERHLTPDFSSPYLDNLVALPLHTLLKEPFRIASEATTVESELTNLCFREYSTFISVHRSSAAVRSAFDDFEGSLSRLLDSVPALEEKCRRFGKGTEGIQGVRGRAALVQEHQDKLLDLLELPQLLETCVRNGYYQEAMELATHAEVLKERYPLALVEDVGKEVEGVIQLMLAQLLALLREPVKLPTLIKAVTYLRRLGSMDEEELGLAFLASRLYNFRAQLVQIERDRAEPVRYLRKYIDLFREHVYDIISQYTAIFADTTQLTSFASLCVADLVQSVQGYVPKVADPASMSSILVQLGYCALSFARVGLEFSALIGTSFVEAVRTSYSQAVSTAATTLGTTLRNAAKSAASPVDVLVFPEHRAAVLGDTSDVTHFPPLAVFANAHLSALNSLRLLAPAYLFPEIVSIQTASLVLSTATVLQYLQQAITLPDMNGERPKHTRTPSSPRAYLLRRNTETQMAPEIRSARRREAQRVCLGFAEAWRATVNMITSGLIRGVYEREVCDEEELKGKLAELKTWIEQNELKEPKGTIIEEPKPLSFVAPNVNGHVTDRNGTTTTKSPIVDTRPGSPVQLDASESPQRSSPSSEVEASPPGPASAIATALEMSSRSLVPLHRSSLSPGANIPVHSSTAPEETPVDSPATAVDKMFATASLDVVCEEHQVPPLPADIATQPLAELQAELEAMDLGSIHEQAAMGSEASVADEIYGLTTVRRAETQMASEPSVSSGVAQEAVKEGEEDYLPVDIVGSGDIVGTVPEEDHQPGQHLRDAAEKEDPATRSNERVDDDNENAKPGGAKMEGRDLRQDVEAEDLEDQAVDAEGELQEDEGGDEELNVDAAIIPGDTSASMPIPADARQSKGKRKKKKAGKR